MPHIKGQLRVNRYIYQIYSAYANNKFYLSIFCCIFYLWSFSFFFYICQWRQFLWWWYAGGKLWRHHALLFVVYLKKLDLFWEIPKKRPRLRGSNSFGEKLSRQGLDIGRCSSWTLKGVCHTLSKQRSL